MTATPEVFADLSRPAPTTRVPERSLDAPPPVPLASPGRLTAEERFVRVGSWVAGFAFAWVVCQRLLPLPGLTWLVIVGFVSGMVFTAVTAAMTGTMVDVRDRVAQGLVTGGALLVAIALASTLVFVFARGWRPLTHLNFFTHDMAGVGPSDPLDKGGVLHAIVGSLIEVGIATAVTLPLGIATAVFMTEIGGRLATVVRTVVEAMTALPSIVAGLFIYSTLIIALGLPRSGLAAALALAVMMLPIIARASGSCRAGCARRGSPSGPRAGGWSGTSSCRRSDPAWRPR
jgi:phosphate transport system permease protein